MTVPDDFADRYGPWALIAGASEGVGAELARLVAQCGVNLLLLSRRAEVLDPLATSIAGDAGVEARTVALDLTAPAATGGVIDTCAGLDVGFLAYCAGADPYYQAFLDQPITNAMDMVQRNCVVPLGLCHHFALPMQERGRGGIVLVSSGAGFIGAPNMVAYGASKAFDTVMAEALWAELHPSGVDVLGVVLGMTDTPALRRLQTGRGYHTGEDVSVAGAADPARVAADILDNLQDGPTLLATPDVQMGAELFATMTRNEAARLMVELGAAAMNPEEGSEP